MLPMLGREVVESQQLVAVLDQLGDGALVFHAVEDAERFVSEADLSEYDLSSFKPLSSFAFAKKKDARLEMRIAQTELDALREEAEKRGIPPSRLARIFIEQGLRQLADHPA